MKRFSERVVRKRCLKMNKKYCKQLIVVSALVASQVLTAVSGSAQSLVANNERLTVTAPVSPASPVAKYSDPQGGTTVDQAVAYALEHNGELLAARKEIEAASSMVKQASLRPNPTVE